MTLVHALDPVDEFLVDNQLVEGLIAFGDIAVLYGAAKTGKSFLAVDLAVALSNGEVGLIVQSTLQRCCIGLERTLKA